MYNCILSGFEVQAKIISIPNNFAFNEVRINKSKLFEVLFIIDNILYEYGFSVLSGKRESGYLYKKVKRKTELFVRRSPKWKDSSVIIALIVLKFLMEMIQMIFSYLRLII